MKPTGAFIRTAAISAIFLWLVFSIPTIANYSHTPPDALKTVGYVFISLYGLAFAIIGGLAAASLQSVIQCIGRPGRKMPLLLFAAVSGATAALLFVLGLKVT